MNANKDVIDRVSNKFIYLNGSKDELDRFNQFLDLFAHDPKLATKCLGQTNGYFNKDSYDYIYLAGNVISETEDTVWLKYDEDLAYLGLDNELEEDYKRIGAI